MRDRITLPSKRNNWSDLNQEDRRGRKKYTVQIYDTSEPKNYMKNKVWNPEYQKKKTVQQLKKIFIF